MQSSKTETTLTGLALVLALGCQAQAPAPETSEEVAPPAQAERGCPGALRLFSRHQ